ncbi:MAG: DMT family transporter [Anaeromicrobium sp.]|jgi:drug/metabolite transporter (DMT)-like permease|uniref:DMT family transporter n=1 Tax=Anaeromicrobium sp. TaxID=1929132 RepID=UPI0025EE93AA|nr:DMT family transporter [Anaeromicrobium sp.]MCT4595398.1 DMT family transporter [Anaeromicrobium sp.]
MKAKYMMIVAIIAISFSSIFIKMSQAPPLIIASYRLGIAVVIMLPMIILKHRKELKAANTNTIKWCVISGIVLALHFLTWVTSLKYTSIASAVVLVNTSPIFAVAGGYVFFKERLNKKAIIGIIIAFVGATLISGGDYTLGSNIIWGDSLAISAALFFAIYLSIGNKARKELSVNSYTFIVYSVAFITLIIISIIMKVPLHPYPLREWYIFLALAVVCTLLGHSVCNWALEYLSAIFVSTVVLAEPIFSIVWAAIIFKEMPYIWQIIGGIIILCGIYTYVSNEK